MAAPSPAEIEGRLVHEVPKPVGFQRVFANQDLTEPSRPQVRGGGFDDGLNDQGAAVNFAVADDTGVGRNSDNERVLRGVCAPLDLGKPEVDRLDIRDSQISHEA